eukprot:5031011-Amphidinium_carterae.1
MHLRQEVIDWFLEYQEITGWQCKRTLEEAKQLSPELFGTVHKDAPRRWLHCRNKDQEKN